MRSWPEVATRVSLSAILATTVALLAACGGATAPAISVTDAWVRAPTAAGTLGAAYFTVSNAGDAADALLRVSVPAASSAMLHQSTTGPDGVTAMLLVERLEVPGGGSVTLAPGGYHVMVEGLDTGLAAGSMVELDLEFEVAGRVVVQAEVRAG